MVVDASVWVSYFLPGDRFHAGTEAWLEAAMREERALAAPSLLLPEVAGAVARRSGSPDLGVEAAERLRNLPTLNLVPLGEELVRLSVEVAATLPVRGADALYIATAQLLRVPLVTWDAEQRARGGLVVPTHSPGDPS